MWYLLKKNIICRWYILFLCFILCSTVCIHLENIKKSRLYFEDYILELLGGIPYDYSFDKQGIPYNYLIFIVITTMILGHTSIISTKKTQQRDIYQFGIVKYWILQFLLLLFNIIVYVIICLITAIIYSSGGVSNLFFEQGLLLEILFSFVPTLLCFFELFVLMGIILQSPVGVLLYQLALVILMCLNDNYILVDNIMLYRKTYIDFKYIILEFIICLIGILYIINTEVVLTRKKDLI